MNATQKAAKLYVLRQQRRAQGVQYDIDLVPAGPSRELVDAAHERGIPYGEIARLTGLRKETVGQLVWKDRKRIRRSTADAIYRGLAGDRHDMRSLVPMQLVPVTPNHLRLVRSMCAQGYTLAHQIEIIQQNGMGSGSVINGLCRRKLKDMRVESLRQLEWLVSVIGNRPGPSHQSMMFMQHRGVFPLKHYTPEGKLNVSSLTPEQRRWVQ